MTPSVLNVMHAVTNAPWRRTAYIVNHLRKQPEFRSVRRELVLRRLRVLEAAGHITCDNIKQGYYGFGWDITPSGEALSVDA